MFSTEIIALWERLAGYLAAGLSTFRAEEALRESEQQFRELAEGIPQLAWTANPDGWIYWYNRRWYEYTGTTPKQMEGWGWQSVHDPNELPKVMERWKSSIATGEPFEMVFPLLGADGVFRPFLTRVMPLRDAQGRVVRWFGTNTDISEQRKMEEALRQSLERLERVLEVETVGVMFWDLNTGIMVDANDAFLKLMGYSRSDVEERKLNWQNLTPPEYLDVSRAEVEKFLATGRVGPYEKEYFRKDGTKQWLLFAGSSLGNNQCVEFCVDISDRKRAEAALRQSEERWITTLRSIGDAVISTDAAGKIMFMNDVAQALTGWTLAEAQGQALETVFNIINEVTREKTENPLSKVLRLGQIVGLANHTALVSRDGTEYPIEDSAAPIRSQDGTTTGIVLVFHDVTEKRKAEQVLRQSERLATTGRLAATLAHEIHNPLDTVGNLLFLIDQVPDLETARQYAAMASDEVVRVTQMTRHMLAFQRESSKPLPVDIAEILDGAVALFDRKIASSNLQIEKQVDFDHEFLGLTSEIRQVLVNLFGNAVEAVGQHGKIRLRARASCNWHDGQRGLRVTVADNGPGIAADVRAKIFEPFFTTKGEAGTGLGLWITSGIVEKYGGTLRLRSVTRPGRSGTTFSVFLPIER